MTKIDVAKKTARFVVGLSTAFTVSGALLNNTPRSNPRHTAEAYVGSFVLGVMVSEKAETWTDRKIDNVVAWWDENVKKDAQK